jgi:hypothetical protein
LCTYREASDARDAHNRHACARGALFDDLVGLQLFGRVTLRGIVADRTRFTEPSAFALMATSCAKVI